MIDFFSSWVKGLGLAIVVVSILEMLLPNNKMKKYIRIVMGIFTLFNIISPLVENRDILDLNSIDVSNYISSSETITNEKVDQSSMNERIAELYKEEMEKDITNKLQEQGYEVSSCKVSANFQEENEKSRITKIKMSVKKTNRTEKDKDDSAENALVKEVQKIRKISINSSEKNNEHEQISISKEDISNIKKFLIEEYEVNERCLEIN